MTREEVNQLTVQRANESEPILIDIQPAKAIVPEMKNNMVLHSGPDIGWSDMEGGQRQAVIGACLYEGLVKTEQEADSKLKKGEIVLQPCQSLGCIGSLTGIYYPSMPVFVVENKTFGNRSFCSIYEGPNRERLTYGVYNEEVKERLDFIHSVIAPILKETIQLAGGIPLKPIMARALRMGDELHSRNTAATNLFLKIITEYLVEVAMKEKEKVLQCIQFINKSDLFFLHLSMAASKSTADAIHNVEGCSLVTAMALNCNEFGIRVSGMGDRWFTAPIPDPLEAKLFEGITKDDLVYMGGESLINETMGLGGFAQASAFTLQSYNGGTSEKMIEYNRKMYEITVDEHKDFKIPYFGFRGVPLGIDIFLVREKGIEPLINMGMSYNKGGQAGAGIIQAPMSAFEKAVETFQNR